MNSDLVVEVISITEGTAEFDVTDLTDVTAVEDGNGYKVISLELQLTYEGTEISDEFSATGSLGVTQDSEFWKVEYRNSTSDDEADWSETMDVLMGIGVDNNDTNQVLTRVVDARITLPLQNQSQTYDEGHAVNMNFAADGGSSEVSVRVFVPQQYNISLVDAPEKIGSSRC